MHGRWIVTAGLAVFVASCSAGGIYDAKDFLLRKPEAAVVAPPADPPAPEAPLATAAAAEPATAAATAAADMPAATASGVATDTTANGAAPAGREGEAAPAGPTLVAAAAATDQPKSFFASFFSSNSAATAAAAAEAAATPAAIEVAAADPAPPGAAPVAPAVTAPVQAPNAAPEEVFGEEISEAELAGEVEADPDLIAVPDMPDDGLKHDFVNVYTAKPDKPVEMYEGLPGVDWPGNSTVLAMRTPDGDPSALFGGSEHPFARVVPGIPRQTIQAANGLLLAHSAINVSCIKNDLLGLVRRAESHFGKKVVVTSGYRSPSHNRRVNGAKHSQHMYCNALDLYMPGVARDDLARWFFAQSDRGGIGLYCHTRSIHIDMGRKRQWRWSCRGRRG